MGYTLPAASLTDFRKGIAERIHFCSNLRAIHDTTTETNYYKSSQDLTNVDYLVFTLYGSQEAAAANGTVKLYCDATTESTISFTQGFGTKTVTEIIDVTGYTGNTTIRVTLDSGENGKDLTMQSIDILGMET